MRDGKLSLDATDSLAAGEIDYYDNAPAGMGSRLGVKSRVE
jgi:hypothetical protein